MHTEMCATRLSKNHEANVLQRLGLFARRVIPRRQAQWEAPAHAHTACNAVQGGNAKVFHSKYNILWVRALPTNVVVGL